MGIDVTWGNALKTLVNVRFAGEWDWGQFYARCGEVAKLFATVKHPVDVIMDMRYSQRLPPDFVVRMELASFYRRNVGRVIIVQPGISSGKVSAGGDQKPEIWYAAALEEAQVLLGQTRSTSTQVSPASHTTRVLEFLHR